MTNKYIDLKKCQKLENVPFKKILQVISQNKINKTRKRFEGLDLASFDVQLRFICPN